MTDDDPVATDYWLRPVWVAVSLPIVTQVFLMLAGWLRTTLRPASGSGAIELARESTWNLGLAQAAAVAVLLLLSWPHRSSGGAQTLRLRGIHGVSALLCFVAGVCLQFVLAEVANLMQLIWPLGFDELARRHRLLTPNTWFEGVGAALSFVALAPFTEELIFRGWMLSAFEKRFGVKFAVVATSVLFGLVHLSPEAIIYATTAGVLLAWVVLRADSLVAGIAMHAGVNAAPLLFSPYLVRIRGFNTLSESVQHIAPALLFLAVAVGVLSLFVFARIHRSTTPLP